MSPGIHRGWARRVIEEELRLEGRVREPKLGRPSRVMALKARRKAKKSDEYARMECVIVSKQNIKSTRLSLPAGGTPCPAYDSIAISGTRRAGCGK